MAKQVSDLIVERLIEWGVDTIFGYPGDGVDGFFESLRTHQRETPLHSGASRGGSRLRCLRLCQVHRPPRRLLRNVGTWRCASSQRSLRC